MPLSHSQLPLASQLAVQHHAYYASDVLAVVFIPRLLLVVVMVVVVEGLAVQVEVVVIKEVLDQVMVEGMEGVVHPQLPQVTPGVLPHMGLV